ncbi:MAG TPA: hypothetical protein PK840_03790 [Bacilli bacterium]|nr:hypothetical protein [Bacilli bacterium]
MKNKILVRDIALIGILTAILFVQEQALTFLPNIQVTVFLIVVYSKSLKLSHTMIIIFIHVILDNLLMGSFNLVYLPFMMIGWMLIPLLLNSLFKKVNDSFPLGLLGILFSFLYSWIMLIPQAFITEVDLAAYWIADIPFEILLALSSFLTILWLYQPSIKVLQYLKS